ncbi:tRNA threonylcarbamoyladenosine biosynthesis protein TsaE [Persephonella hydrogeniphila]|uniref:tRNA threonylcarbamoyladenosine biosynthesis protein TsaE n=1 Tax=Persephonella hydrogeniphila TaxID=198703 RepID=A0A285NLB1_9AQUI|nr:tRNA (adenosine(37)-N6)-threonylcarbamoyltransferase complex ATPase subunit type 1 TsaE [Persephonella hydrogeniphila]SNZ10290.1 tRNA threonylcarbamoyladenosine biosynthesis protein TsaE [Persephonella hydrogeniphila]
MKTVKKINSLQELKKFVEKLSRCLKGDEIILLKGNLAAGKTTFTKFLVSSIDPEAEDQVNSPTFSVMNEYETSKFPVYHIDLYRVKEFDFSDILGHGLVIIEWAEDNMIDIDSLPVIFIDFEITGENERILRITLRNGDYLKRCLK